MPDIIEDVFALFDELRKGKKLGPPVSKPLSSLFKGLHELRLSGQSGEFRAFYIIKSGDAIFFIYAAAKKSQKIDRKTREVIKARARSLNL